MILPLLICRIYKERSKTVLFVCNLYVPLIVFIDYVTIKADNDEKAILVIGVSRIIT